MLTFTRLWVLLVVSTIAVGQNYLTDPNIPHEMITASDGFQIDNNKLQDFQKSGEFMMMAWVFVDKNSPKSAAIWSIDNVYNLHFVRRGIILTVTLPDHGDGLPDQILPFQQGVWQHVSVSIYYNEIMLCVAEIGEKPNCISADHYPQIFLEAPAKVTVGGLAGDGMMGEFLDFKFYLDEAFRTEEEIDLVLMTTACSPWCHGSCWGPGITSCLEFAQLIMPSQRTENALTEHLHNYLFGHHAEVIEDIAISTWINPKVTRDINILTLTGPCDVVDREVCQILSIDVKAQRVIACIHDNCITAHEDYKPDVWQLMFLSICHTSPNESIMYFGVCSEGLCHNYQDKIDFAIQLTAEDEIINLSQGSSEYYLSDLRLYYDSCHDLNTLHSYFNHFPCDEFCASCNNAYECEECIIGFKLIDGKCTSKMCHNSCAECEGAEDTECTKCNAGYYAWADSGICREICPYGYEPNEDRTCHGESETILFYRFDKTDMIISDYANGIVAINGEKVEVDADDACPAKFRGYLFAGNAKMRLPIHEIDSNPVILPHKFSVEIWMRYFEMPDRQTLLAKWSDETEHFMIQILPNNALSAFVGFTGNKQSMHSEQGKLRPGDWTHIMFVLLQYGRDSITAVMINLQMAINPNSATQNGYYKDEPDYKFGIGYIHDTQFFNGFLWELKVSEDTQLGPNFKAGCDGCGVCPSSSSQCIPTCGYHEFYDDVEQECGQCMPKCFAQGACGGCVDELSCGSCPKACICDNYDCVRCISNAVMIDNKCECQDGFYFDDFCKPCHASCKSCFGMQIDQCLTCVDPALVPTSPTGISLTGGMCNTCAPGYFLSNVGRCLACQEGCSECSSARVCTACRGTLSLVNGACACDEGQFFDSETDTCTLCHYSCAECIHGPFPFQCSACRAGAVVDLDGYCQCEDPDYIISPDSGECDFCPTSVGILIEENCHCLGNRKRVASICAVANTDCPRCNDNDLEHCTDCSFGLKLFHGLFSCADHKESADPCPMCPPDVYFNVEEFKCECPGGFQYINNQCVPISQCSAGTFYDGSGCRYCDRSCGSCFGPDANNCIICSSDSVMVQNQCFCKESDQFRDPKSGMCNGCPPFFKFSEARGICMPNCPEGKVAEDLRCVVPCTPGQFRLDDEHCGECSKTCKNCEPYSMSHCTDCFYDSELINGTCICKPENPIRDKNTFRCTSCPGDRTWDGSECVINCLPGEYAGGDYCNRCPPSCKECLGMHQCTLCYEDSYLDNGECYCKNKTRNTQGVCEECTGDMVAIKNTCVLICGERQYGAGDTCHNCNHICKSCKGPSATECITCSDDSHLQNGTCACNDENRHKERISGTCQACPKNTNWDENYQQCYSTCGPGFYASDTECRPCNPMCLTCEDDKSTSCLSCGENASLNEINECACDEDFILDVETFGCIKCGTGTLWNPLHMKCENICDVGFYWDRKECQKCSSNCQECSDFSACLSCWRGTVLINGVCVCPNHRHHVNPETKECEPCPGIRTWSNELEECNLVCPEKTYIHGDSCLPCAPICATCDGPTALQCTSCFQNAVLVQGICICYGGMHMNPITFQCEECPPGMTWNVGYQICLA